MKKISPNDVYVDILKSQAAKYDRGRSWEHCYAFFREYKKIREKNSPLLDHAALHLAFFLASWGMLRGSSFLLKKDYKFYVPLVKILTVGKYDELRGINWLIEKEKDGNIGLLFGLKKELEEKIAELNREDGDDKKHTTELIISKIMVATIGCAPAYDKFFKNGIREWNKDKEEKYKKLHTFTQESFKDLLIASQAESELKSICKLSLPLKDSKSVFYPSMKLLDLYFWLLGGGKD